jgi:hypothetical protein
VDGRAHRRGAGTAAGDRGGGKTLPGSACGGEDGRHLLAALDHGHGVVPGQVEAGAKTNEIPLFSTLQDRIGIQNAVSPPTRCMPSVSAPAPCTAAARTM